MAITIRRRDAGLERLKSRKAALGGRWLAVLVLALAMGLLALAWWRGGPVAMRQIELEVATGVSGATGAATNRQEQQAVEQNKL